MNDNRPYQAHQAWLGYLQPDGLVVSPAALVDSQVFLDANILEHQEKFKTFVVERDRDDKEFLAIENPVDFLLRFLEWPEDCVFGSTAERPIPEELKIPLPELGETLQPSYALKDPQPQDPTNPWLLLVHSYPVGEDLDAAFTQAESSWSASISRRFERLLRETKIPIGLLFNGVSLRLIFSPRGENSGTLTFPVDAMVEVAGRPILGALRMLLHKTRLLTGPRNARLPAILALSRDYQTNVSEQLAKQVLESLYELIRGFQAADERSKGRLLKEVIAKNPNDVYGGLLTVLLRLVFILYAEDRGLMPGSDLYVRNYSIHGLFQRLRNDYEKYPDTMDQRYGAWSQLLVLFHAIYFGCRHRLLGMPAREGFLFDPDRYPFLEGQTSGEHHIPLVSDGVIFRVLRNLLILDGERLSYRTLDVEQIGSVYETMVGFKIEIAEGQTIALKPAKAKGAPVCINLEKLLDTSGDQRIKWLREKSDHKLTGESADSVMSASTIDGLLAALEKKISRRVTPGTLAQGALVLQPSDERRKTGSHYTPRKLTEPIVRKSLEPILKRFGEKPTPEQILDLKIADIAVGSGAFLVEASRQLGDEVVKAWHAHNQMPQIPLDEDEVLHARRVVAQRCLYGVDRNLMAVDLAKLSLWLATLAKDHPFTFLDHSIRCGDSLAGLTRKQIADFHWRSDATRVFGQDEVEKRIENAAKFRKELIEADEFVSPDLKSQKLGLADESLNFVRLAGDCTLAAFFAADNDRERSIRRNAYRDQFLEFFRTFDASKNVNTIVNALREGEHPILAFHWEIEFPEVFNRENAGFDAIVGNPPFAGRTTLSESHHKNYIDWLKQMHVEAHGNSDLVAHFFRRGFNLIRNDGTLGLIATNTIGQGDTRSTGLRFICVNGGTIYAARRRLKWPGQAAVVVSVIHVCKGKPLSPCVLNGKEVSAISAYLFHKGGHGDPARLKANENLSFQGCVIVGMGFTFDDTDTMGVASRLHVMQQLIAGDDRNRQRIFPYIGGEEINENPTHTHHRFVINFEDFPLGRADIGVTWATADENRRREWLRSGIVPLDFPNPVASDWPDLLRIVEERVKPERISGSGASADKTKRAEKWWVFSRSAKDLYQAIGGMDKVIAVSRVGRQLAFAIMPNDRIFAESTVVFALPAVKGFCVLQGRVHEVWARFFASSMKDDLRYTSSDCFETFPFPNNWGTNQILEQVGHEYYQFRAELMVRNIEGLTKTYNRFHDPDEKSPDIIRLRELHSTMDRAVLDAYGWKDIKPSCQFILDYEEDDEEDEGRKRKKPWRYRWPDEVRDEVLARLLELNRQRAEEEALVDARTRECGNSSKAKARNKKAADDPTQVSLNLEIPKKQKE